MSSLPVAPIRQPRGPSANAFGAQPQPTTSSAPSPPAADHESLLRRNNTIGSSTRHQTSASISANPAASSAFHGRDAKYAAGQGSQATNRFRSGSLSSGAGADATGLVRRVSGREVRTQEVVHEHESGEEGAVESGTWGKGLSRQSSLPSRRGFNNIASVTPSQPESAYGSMAPPPRPPRRTSAAMGQNGTTPPPPLPSAHVPSHSLSSLSMLSRTSRTSGTSPFEAATLGAAGVSRTQSLREQARNADVGNLGRSTSLRAAGEHGYRPSAASAVSPPTQATTPRHPFTPPTPPPVSSTAALPPFQLPLSDNRLEPGADIKRHQSLTQGYGRVRERLERSPAVLSLEQRDDLRRRLVEEAAQPQGLQPADQQAEEPPTSPIGTSLWSISHRGDDGWTRPTQQLQEAFDAMQIGRTTPRQQSERRLVVDTAATMPGDAAAGLPPHLVHPAEEPSWVTNLVGQADRFQSSQAPVRSASAGGWNDREALLRSQGYSQQLPQRWDQAQLMSPPLTYLQQHQLLAAGYGGMPPFKQPQSAAPLGQFAQPPPYLNPAFNPALAHPYGQLPNPALQPPPPHQDMAVIELARSKGLNPATYNCRPSQARFFVIKSYTEEDVQKSLKHEIWSSTVLGNKRLDTAFRESADQMPIYLFFSVNGSRHFCGVAQMLTPVDETQSSTVWAQDKWKGIFKVKWIFVRDVPSAALRHIRLMNTPEQKPITNSRDTQELHYEAGCEVLQIFLDHQTKSKTSLLQDFAFYEQLSQSRTMGNGSPMPPASAPPAPGAFMGMPPPGNGIPPVPQVPARYR